MAGREEPQEVLGEILIRFEGSSTLNRITSFKTPITGRSEASSDDEPSQLEFESRVLIKSMMVALRKLI